MKKISIILISLLTFSYAAPAFPGVIQFEQSDGTTFEGNLKGDEYFSWVEAKADGSIIKYNKSSKNYEYAVVKEVEGALDLLPSGVKVSAEHNISRSASIFDKSKLFEIWAEKRKNRAEDHK